MDLEPEEFEELMNEFPEDINREFACTVMMPVLDDNGNWQLEHCGAAPVEFNSFEGKGTMRCEEGHRSILERS